MFTQNNFSWNWLTTTFNLQHLRLNIFFPVKFSSWFNFLAWSTDSWQTHSFTSTHSDRKLLTEIFSYFPFCGCSSSSTKSHFMLASWCFNILHLWKRSALSGKWTVKQRKSRLLAVLQLLLKNAYFHFKLWQNIWPLKGFHSWCMREKDFCKTLLDE